MYVNDDMISLRTNQSDTERAGSFMSAAKPKGRVSLGFPMFNALVTLAFNLQFPAEFDTEILIRIWAAAGNFLPVTKTGLDANRVLTRMQGRESSNFMFKSDSQFKPKDLSVFRPQSKQPAADRASASSVRFTNDAEKYGYGTWGCVDYLGPSIRPVLRAMATGTSPESEAESKPAPDEPLPGVELKSKSDSETEVACESEFGVGTEPDRAAGANADAPMSPATPQRKRADGLSGDSPGPLPPADAERCILRLHGTSIFPSTMADGVLLDHNGCYTDGLVDLFFAETAAKQGTQRVSVLLAHKLSEVNSDATGRYEPHKLLNYGKSLIFDNKKGIISVPITVTTSTSQNSAEVVPWHQMIFITVLLSTHLRKTFFSTLIHCDIKPTSSWSSASSLPE